MKGDQDRGRTRNKREDYQDRSSDGDKNSDSYYSDDYENTTYRSDRSPSFMSRSSQAKKLGHKMRSSTPLHNQASNKVGSKFPSRKGGAKWGFRSQSLNKESPPKDIALVTKRVLSARLLKINELRNEIRELQIKLEQHQKENKILKKLQFRQEKALNRFEDTESEISQLISRHNNETRALKEHLRKSQERERNTEKRLKEAEDELYRANSTVKKLKQLSENQHLGEREELAKKLDITETKLDEQERRVQDLEKKLEITQNSFQRQLMVEKKKIQNAQEENKMLLEELQKLTYKLKEKERELDVKNIYAYRLSKPSPKKDAEINPRWKEARNTISTGVQTTAHISLVEISSLSHPTPAIPGEDVKEKQHELLQMKQKDYEKQLREEAEKLRKHKELEERKREEEQKQQRQEEQRILEEKAKKMREEWEKEELERKRRENFYQDKIGKQNIQGAEDERLKKELLLAKMNEIDKESENTMHFDSLKSHTQTLLSDSSLKHETKETKHKIYKFTEPTQNLFSGIPVQGGREASLAANEPKVTNEKRFNNVNDVSFGSYAPSFAKTRSGGPVLKTEILEEPDIINHSKFNMHTDKKSNLMEQLFGNDSNAPVRPKSSDSIAKNESKSIFPLEKGGDVKIKNYFFSGDGKNVKPTRHNSQYMTGNQSVKALDSLEDDIEEVALQ
ncbi:hypothetical protein XENTR_v10013945 [Xenopus tropicalis]|uniref:Lebercilin n=1 Tax=Xenopus tropicalis TaxID=8364 RepID=A0A6I8PT87_XENTR|nr:lebercilin [Xenopus tropicalis]KAE8602319.1 hypothetical protein XENTR_v10013945 [Xenopus tropicalis]